MQDGKPQAQQQAHRETLHSAFLSALSQAARRDIMVPVPQIMRQLGIPPEQAKAMLTQLSDAGALYLSPYDNPRDLSPEDKAYLPPASGGIGYYATPMQQPDALAPDQGVQSLPTTPQPSAVSNQRSEVSNPKSTIRDQQSAIRDQQSRSSFPSAPAAAPLSSQLASLRDRLPRVKMSNAPSSPPKPSSSYAKARAWIKATRATDKPVSAGNDAATVRSQVEAMIDASPIVRDADGVPIRMDYPDRKGVQGTGLLDRIAHLIGRGAERVFDPNKARTVLSTPTTLQDYHLKLRMPSGAIGYMRHYADGTKHLVLTVEMPSRERVVIGQEVVSQGLETQYPLNPSSTEIERAVVLQSRPPNTTASGSKVQASALPAAGNSSVVTGAHSPSFPPSSQTGATPNAPSTGSIKPSQPAVNSPKPGIPADQARQAVRNLSQVAPEVTQRTVIIPNRDSLNEGQWHPEDWEAFATTEGFYHAQSGLTFLFTDNVVRRAGETPARAAARVILHERLGHAGLRWFRQVNPKGAQQWQALVEQIATDPVLSVEIASLGQQQGYQDLDPDGLVEEWAVRQLESLTDAELAALQPTTPLGKVWQWIKDQLNRLTGNFSRKDATLRELRDVFALCRQALASGEYDLASPLDYITETQQLGAMPSFLTLDPSAASATVENAADTEHPARSRSRNPARPLALMRGQNSGADQSILLRSRGTQQVSQPSREDAAGKTGQRSGFQHLPRLNAAAFEEGVAGLDHRNGDEHEVWHDPVSNRAVKITKPAALNQGVEGYLHRLATVNQVFGDDITIEGWIIDADGQPQLVTSQPWVEGTQPSAAQIETYMRRKGFLKAMDGLWYREQDDSRSTPRSSYFGSVFLGEPVCQHQQPGPHALQQQLFGQFEPTR